MRTSAPDEGDDLDVEQLLASRPPTRKRSARRKRPAPAREQVDAIRALRDLTDTLTAPANRRSRGRCQQT